MLYVPNQVILWVNVGKYTEYTRDCFGRVPGWHSFAEKDEVEVNEVEAHHLGLGESTVG